MAIATTTGLNPAQQRALNIIAAAGNVPAGQLMQDGSVDAINLRALHTKGLVHTLLLGEQVDPADLPLRLPTDVIFTPSVAGLAWVASNPGNRALRAIQQLDRGLGGKVADVVREADVEASTLAGLVFDGLAVLIGNDERQVPANDHTRVHDIVRSRAACQWARLRLTGAGRHLINQ